MKNINDKTLLLKTKQLVEQERKTLKEILEHLQEIYDRRLFADLGYSSLFKYLVKELKYSEGAAARRISALRLVKKVPEAKKMIEAGELNLTVASQTQGFTQNRSIKETKEVLKKVSGKTKDEAQKLFFSMTEGDTAVVKEKINRIGENEVRMHITVTDETRSKIKLVKDYYKCSTNDALDLALDLLLKNREEKLLVTRKSKGTKGRSIPAKVKKTVLSRAKSHCEYPGCEETRNLEYEHIHPYSLGGQHTEGNLKLYCRSHNQRAAVLMFGKDYMMKYLDSSNYNFS
jgi:hypothetical protein